MQKGHPTGLPFCFFSRSVFAWLSTDRVTFAESLKMALDFFDEHLRSDDTLVFLHSGDGQGASLIGRGTVQSVALTGQGSAAFASVDAFLAEAQGKVLGWMGYELKNSIEQLETKHPDKIGFPDLFLFTPQHLEEVHVPAPANHPPDRAKPPTPALKARRSKAEYLRDVRHLQAHIQRGDIYEVNYCQEFYAENVHIDPVDVYRRLHALTQAPFSAFVHHEGSYMLCGSPERYLKKSGGTLMSQPIKGTVKRGADAAEDLLLRNALERDEKERGENIMITDLVRNDLARISVPGSVEVEELCGIYTFKTVHQMISTVRSEALSPATFTDILKGSFPMGSMTGAPKVRAMELIDATEAFARGLYSGSVGWIDGSDFDFNVVIRSIFWNRNTGYLSVRVGGAITALSEPEREYNECMLKADALFKALGQ